MLTKFWWIRHAPVIKNNNCCYGNNEVDCDTSEISSFEKIIKHIPNNCNVYTSKLSRTIKTLNATVELGYQYKKHIIDDRLTEQDLGDYAGMKYDELYNLTKKIGVDDKNWLMKPSHTPPNGESFHNLYKRVKSFVDEMLIVNKNKDIIIFSHGGPIRAAISYALNYNINEILSIDVENTKTTLISYDKSKNGRLIFLNR